MKKILETISRAQIPAKKPVEMRGIRRDTLGRYYSLVLLCVLICIVILIIFKTASMYCSSAYSMKKGDNMILFVWFLG